MVYVSSDAVYDENASLVTEASPPGASSYHGLMHLLRERMLIQTVVAPLAILRPSALYGAGDTHNGYGPNRFLRSALERRQIALFGGGEEKRDHLHIADFVHVVDRVIKHRSKGVINVASGTAVTFRKVAETVRRLVGADVAIRASERTMPITHRHFDTAALIKAVPEFRPRALDEGLRLMITATTG